MRTFLSLLAVLLFACGQTPGTLVIEPDAKLGPPNVKAEPPAGPFNGEVVVTFQADRPATIYLSTNGLDPRTNKTGRVSGPSPLTVTLATTTTVKYFASADGKDGDLGEGTWVRAGGPVGTISGMVVVGAFVVGQQVGVMRNATIQSLATPTEPSEIPFTLTGLASGTHRLSAIADRNGDGQLVPFLDFQSATVPVELDLMDPLKAGPENVRLYLGASASGLGTLRGTITLPNPPPLQNLQISILDPMTLTGGVDPAALLQQLQGGYRIFTNQTDTEYPYVITDLMPGRVNPVPSLFGFGNGGIALNVLANPLSPVTIVADQESIANFAYGPITVSGEVALGSMTAPTGPLAFGMLGAKTASATEGIQAMLMPLLFTNDTVTGTARARYSGTALRANSTISLRVFTNAGGANPITDALAWVVNPFAMGQPHATVNTVNTDVVQDISVP